MWPSRVLGAWYQVKLLRVNGRDNDSSGPGAPGLIKEYYAKGMVFFSAVNLMFVTAGKFLLTLFYGSKLLRLIVCMREEYLAGWIMFMILKNVS